jgi:hypothetical protein
VDVGVENGERLGHLQDNSEALALILRC